MSKPASKPHQASESTRQRLLEKGLKAFFVKSEFNAVSTPELAEKAGANQSTIPYHFRGKEGLYIAVVEKLATELIRKMVAFLVGTYQARFNAAFIIRESMHPSEAYNLLYKGYMRQVRITLARLVTSLLDASPTPSRASCVPTRPWGKSEAVAEAGRSYNGELAGRI